MVNEMRFRPIKFALFFLTIFLYAPILSAAEDVGWVFGKEPILETGSGSPEIGTRWALGARNDDVQITFRLEVATDMKQGGWIGDIRAPEKFYVKVYLVDEVGEKIYFKLENGKAVGPDAEFGVWKKGPVTTEQQMLMFDFSWEQMQMIKKAKAIVLGYSLFDSPNVSKDVTVSLDNFNMRLAALEASVKSVDGGARYVITQEQINTTPLNDLPKAVRGFSLGDVKQISKELSVPVIELLELSKGDIQKLRRDKAEALMEAKHAKTRKAHQAIYDQEPEWFDINVCPKPDVGYCNDIGKAAYYDSAVPLIDGKRLVGAMAFKIGQIFGVVWRSKGSIIEIYRGDVKWDRDPKIYRAPKAEYYYIIKSGSQIKVIPSMDIYAKG